jgi:hypothetical protein
MSINRQYGVHEIPGTEAEAPNQARQVSAAFEGQMRDYIAAIWVKLGELEHVIEDFKAWREELNYRLLSRVSPEPLSSVAPEQLPSAESNQTRKTADFVNPKPWLAEGVSKATWYRRQKDKEGA